MQTQDAMFDDDRYRFLADAVPDIVWTAKPDGSIDYYNQRWYDYTGLTFAQTKDWGWKPVLHPDDLEKTIVRWTGAVATSEPYEIEYRFLRASDQSYRWFLGRALPMRDAQGCIIMWVGTCTDMDDSKRAREALHRADARTREILDNIAEAFIALDRDWRIVYVNPEAARINGKPAEAFLGRVHWEEWPSAVGCELERQFRRAMAEQVPAHFDHRYVGEGHDVWLEVHAYPSEGGLNLLYRDISERKQAESERREALARQRAFLRDVLASVTEGKLRLCGGPADLPPPLPACGDPINLAAPGGLRALRRRTEEEAIGRGFADDRWQDIETATGEAAMNALVHAGGGEGRVCADANTLQVWVEDRGRGIEVENLPKATLAKGYTTAGTLGHGLKMMLQTADRVWLLTGPGGTTVVLEQNRLPPQPAWP